jgi:hypothetical protein
MKEAIAYFIITEIPENLSGFAILRLGRSVRMGNAIRYHLVVGRKGLREAQKEVIKIHHVVKIGSIL